ncbi:MAG: hypothetical protein Q7U89_01480 [Coriobacteriia bacterium]|nr:hypothetical protein [Coriobacteriia bacterium]
MESTQKQIVIGLVVIAALLAAIAGVLIWQNNSNAIPAPSANAADTSGAATAANPAATTGTGMPGATGTAPDAEFNPATAPKVASGQTPEEYVKTYYQACQDGKFVDAYKMLPTATQAYYQSEAGFESTLKGYGITGFTVQPQAEAGDSITVVGAQAAQGMEFPYTWTFVKGDGGSWLVKSRAMGGK